MEKLVEYIKNIDLEMVNDSDILDNVYEEIKGNERELILNTETTFKIQTLIQKSNAKQLKRLCNKLDFNGLINKKLGSRILEEIIKNIFIFLYEKKDKLNIKKITEILDTHLDHKILDENATHVIRFIFQLVSGKKIEHQKITKHKTETKDQLKKYKSIIKNLIPNLNKEYQFITVLTYLQCCNSKKIIMEIIEKHFDWDSPCKPGLSYFYEDLIKIASEEALDNMFEKIKGHEEDLASDARGNYFLSEFILQYPKQAKYFYEKINIDNRGSHSNIVMKLVQSLQKSKNFDIINKIIVNYYGITENNGSIIDKTFGGDEGHLKQKYAPMLVGFMDLPEEHNYGIQKAFRDKFNLNWLRFNGGIQLLLGYYKGVDTMRNKREFTRNINRMIPKIAMNRECKKIIKLMLIYAYPDQIKMIKNIQAKQ